MSFPVAPYSQKTPIPSATQQVAGVGDTRRNPDIESAMPQAPGNLQMGCWDKFKRAAHTHSGARNAALIGQVLNCSARSAALAVTIAAMPFNWKGFVEVPLHVVATGVELMNLMVVAHAYVTGPSSITGKELRDANIFLTLGNATNNAFLKEYSEYINMATTTTPLAASAIFSGLIPVMETLGIPVPDTMRTVLANNASTSITDSIASSSRLIQRHVVNWFIEGHENEMQRAQTESSETHEAFAIASGPDGFGYVIQQPEIVLSIEGGELQATLAAGSTAQAAPVDDVTETGLLVPEDSEGDSEGDSEEYFDALDQFSNDWPADMTSSLRQT